MVTILPVQNKNFSGDPEEPNEVPGSGRGSQKSFTRTIPWHLASLVKNYPGIIVRQHHTDQKQMGLLREQCAEWKKGHLRNWRSQVRTKWWADSVECYCYLRNIQDLLSDGKTPYERRFGMQLNGPVIPFGAIVECHPVSAKDTSRLHQFGPKVLPGIFIGFVLYAERIWKGDMPIADTEELEQMDAPELHARRLNAKEVLTPMKGDNFMFPVADGTVEVSGGDQRLRPSTLIQDRREPGVEQGVLRGESDGLSSPIPLQDVSTRDDAEAKYDFWSITGDFIYRHHVELRVKLYVPRKESFLIPLQFFDVTRNTNTSLDAQLEKNIVDYWNVDGIGCMDGLHKNHFIERKASWRIYMVWCETYEETNDLKTRQCMARYVEAYVWGSEAQSKAKVDHRETKAR